MRQRKALLLSFLVVPLGASAGDSSAIELLSDPSSWGINSEQPSETSAHCPSTSVEDFARGVGLSSSRSLEEFEATVRVQTTSAKRPYRVERHYYSVPPTIRERVTDDHEFQLFNYTAHLSDGTWWGYSGYLIALEGCIVHAAVTSFDN